MATDIQRAEKQRRERCWDKQTRWQVLQSTITWAESQRLARRNTPSACRREEARLLGRRSPR